MASTEFYQTFEIRWFWTSQKPGQCVAWFDSGTNRFDRKGACRTDHYLVLPGCTSTGVKLREDCFEIKAMIEKTGPINVKSKISGQVQRWLKWSMKRPGFSEIFGLKSAAPSWQPILKNRLMRFYSLERGAVCEMAATMGKPDNAPLCFVEMTQVSGLGIKNDWLTLGFETQDFGPQSLELLKKTVHMFFQQQPQLPDCILSAASLSYPEWLTKLQG